MNNKQRLKQMIDARLDKLRGYSSEDFIRGVEAGFEALAPQTLILLETLEGIATEENPLYIPSADAHRAMKAVENFKMWMGKK